MEVKKRVESNSIKKRVIHIIYWLLHLFVLLIWKIPSQNLRLIFYRFLGMSIGKKSIIWWRWEIFLPNKVKIWKNSVIWSKVLLDARMWIEIWNNVNFSSEVAIYTLQHDVQNRNFDCVWKKVIINDYSWISTRVTILPWVTIWKWAVVAAGAVVTKDVPDYMIVWWIPAKIIWERNKELTYTLNSDWFIPFI